jgi:HK97 gp10 family phage protein
MSETIIGLENFERLLKSMELFPQKQLLVAATKAGAELIREEGERRAPRDSGLLAEEESIQIKEAAADEVVARIGPSKKAFYGVFVEFGTVLMPARPFLTPAYETKKNEALKVAGAHLAAAIIKRFAIPGSGMDAPTIPTL